MLLVIASLTAAIVARSDVEAVMQNARASAKESSWGECALRCFVLIPCTWCCCPWIPLLWLVGGGVEGVKSRWMTLITDVSALAASIVGTNVVTGSVDALAAGLGICSAADCSTRVFVALEVTI